MKRLCVLILALALAVVMAAPAFATWTRVMTMGNQSMFIQDDYNIWMWPSTMNNYPRHMIVDHSVSASSWEFGDLDIDGSTQVGMIVPFMRQMVLGAFISNFDVEWPYSPGEADQKINLLWGYRGANMDLGLRIDFGGTGSEWGGKVSTSVLGLNGGAGFNVNGNMLEVAAMYHSYSFKNEEQPPAAAPFDPITEKDAGSDIALSARYLHAYNSMTTLVPAFSYRTQKLGYTVPNSTVSEEYSATGWDLGVGCNTVPLQGTEFLTSIGVRSLSETVDTSGGAFIDFSDMHLPYIAFGSEIQVKNWLSFRFGAEKSWWSDKDNIGSPEFKSWGADFSYMVGAGIMVGDLQFDVEVNPSWFNAGPHFVSGYSAGPMFGWVSIKYDYR